jgi:hypothetical protein
MNASQHLPHSYDTSTGSSQIYIPSVTTFTNFEDQFISVSSLSKLVLRICLIVDMSPSLLFIGHCRSSAPFGHLCDNIAFCEEQFYFDWTLDRHHLQINRSRSRSRSRLGDYTHIPVIFGSLLVSNLLQSIGTIIDTRWVYLGMVSPGTLCSLQGLSIPTWPAHILIDWRLSMASGGIKQTGNVGTAVW